MPKVIIITDVDLDGYYRYTMQYLDAKYHQFDTEFQDFPVSEGTEAQISALNVWAGHQQDDGSGDGTPNGKRVY